MLFTYLKLDRGIDVGLDIDLEHSGVGWTIKILAGEAMTTTSLACSGERGDFSRVIIGLAFTVVVLHLRDAGVVVRCVVLGEREAAG